MASVIHSLWDLPNFSLPRQWSLCSHLLPLCLTHVVFVEVVKYNGYSTVCSLETALTPSVWTPALWKLLWCLLSPAFSWSILFSRVKKLHSKHSVCYSVEAVLLPPFPSILSSVVCKMPGLFGSCPTGWLVCILSVLGWNLPSCLARSIVSPATECILSSTLAFWAFIFYSVKMAFLPLA